MIARGQACVIAGVGVLVFERAGVAHAAGLGEWVAGGGAAGLVLRLPRAGRLVSVGRMALAAPPEIAPSFGGRMPLGVWSFMPDMLAIVAWVRGRRRAG